MVAITFVVAVKKFADNLTDAALVTAVTSWLNTTLSVTTVHKLYIEHIQGFYVCIICYV